MSLSSPRYAKALLDLSEERALSSAVAGDMVFVREALASSRELQVFLSSPVVKPYQKKKVLSQVFAGLSELSQKFITLVVDHGREGLLSQIAVNYLEACRSAECRTARSDRSSHFGFWSQVGRDYRRSKP